jgi:hypothetical protein
MSDTVGACTLLSRQRRCAQTSVKHFLLARSIHLVDSQAAPQRT